MGRELRTRRGELRTRRGRFNKLIAPGPAQPLCDDNASRAPRPEDQEERSCRSLAGQPQSPGSTRGGQLQESDLVAKVEEDYSHLIGHQLPGAASRSATTAAAGASRRRGRATNRSRNAGAESTSTGLLPSARSYQSGCSAGSAGSHSGDSGGSMDSSASTFRGCRLPPLPKTRSLAMPEPLSGEAEDGAGLAPASAASSRGRASATANPS